MTAIPPRRLRVTRQTESAAFDKDWVKMAIAEAVAASQNGVSDKLAVLEAQVISLDAVLRPLIASFMRVQSSLALLPASMQTMTLSGALEELATLVEATATERDAIVEYFQAEPLNEAVSEEDAYDPSEDSEELVNARARLEAVQTRNVRLDARRSSINRTVTHRTMDLEVDVEIDDDYISPEDIALQNAIDLDER